MTDPAVEASVRTHRKMLAAMGIDVPQGQEMSTSWEIAAAREALAPLRELHGAVWDDEDQMWRCEHEGLEWPCATARLIYPGEEL